MSGLEDTNNNGVKNKLGELNKTGEGEISKAGEVGETGINKGDGNSRFSKELKDEHNNDYLKIKPENDKKNNIDPENDKKNNIDPENDKKNNIDPENDKKKVSETGKADETGINKGDGNSRFSEELKDEHNNDYLKIKPENDKKKNIDPENDKKNNIDPENDKTKVSETGKADETGINKGDENSGFSEELDAERNDYLKTESEKDEIKTDETGETGEELSRINKGDGKTGFSEELNAERNDYLKTESEKDEIKTDETGETGDEIESEKDEIKAGESKTESENDKINVDIQPNAETKVNETDKAGEHEMGKPELNGLEQQSENDEYGSGNTMALSSREIADVLKRRYPGQVSSSTIPPNDAKMVHMAGEKHPITGIVYDLKGFPIFDDVAVFDTRIPENIASKHDSEAHKRAATRSLRKSLQDPDQKKKR
ncbi:putative sodium/potassium/calcium exchanger [Methanosarcina barkeri]|uniref:hypothetical protein n=1 Tax=Methanosarcina barkeri TaxID=2208 RepID=UPI0006D2992A|nr:hypothetical protein [Methanosarcina barkeri]